MHDHALNMETLQEQPCAIIPATFLKAWHLWLNRPTEAPRPETVDNTPFICTHDLLNLDPNSTTDFDSSFALIKRDDWDTLENL
jgi:hypothetical protein